MTTIELLSPARTVDDARQAIYHGADAVYIGAAAFSARAEAGNGVDDIASLTREAHLYGVRIFVALNTILTDDELREAVRLAWQLYEAHVDALIIQDLGLLTAGLPPIELHASTQADIRTPERVRLLAQLGFRRVVLARELSVQEIAAIHAAVPEVELECFIHGALCVSYSGQCYLSAALATGSEKTLRSANRGRCAQPCRLPMSLYAHDRDGKTVCVADERHLLSLRDMNRAEYLEDLLHAGVTSFKIEGRLKETSYIKNITAFYHQRLQTWVAQHADEWQRASRGTCTIAFTPVPAKSFNRGFTPYFADGQRRPIWNFNTPKAVGEEIGTVSAIHGETFTLRETVELHNGDGLTVRHLGFRLNRFDPATGALYPLGGRQVTKTLRVGDRVFRNLDVAFKQQLERKTAVRRLTVRFALSVTATGATLQATCDNVTAEASCSEPLAAAERPQVDLWRDTLAALGDTPFQAEAVNTSGNEWFLPRRTLKDLRAEVLTRLTSQLQAAHIPPDAPRPELPLYLKGVAKGILPTNYLANVANEHARALYAFLGVNLQEMAFEVHPQKEAVVMQTRHCLKYALGQCKRYPNPEPEKTLAPYVTLQNEAVLKIGKSNFILKFGCNNDCISEIIITFAPLI